MEAEKFHVAGVRSGQAFANFDSGCFTGAVRAEKAEAFARAHFEVEAVDGHDVLISLP
jgi:hypothetical protein